MRSKKLFEISPKKWSFFFSKIFQKISKIYRKFQISDFFENVMIFFEISDFFLENFPEKKFFLRKFSDFFSNFDFIHVFMVYSRMFPLELLHNIMRAPSVWISYHAWHNTVVAKVRLQNKFWRKFWTKSTFRHNISKLRKSWARR